MLAAVVLGLAGMPASAQMGDGVRVEIVEPHQHEVIVEGQTFTFQSVFFNDTAMRMGTPNDPGDVITATLTASPSTAVHIAGGEQEVDFIPAGNAYSFDWQVTCTEAGEDVELEVAVTGGGETYTDTVVVLQRLGHPSLDVSFEILGVNEEHNKVYVDQEYSIQARVENVGGEPIKMTQAELLLDGDVMLHQTDAIKGLGTLDPGEVNSVKWTVKCTGTMDAGFRVHVWGQHDVDPGTMIHGYSLWQYVEQWERYDLEVIGLMVETPRGIVEGSYDEVGSFIEVGVGNTYTVTAVVQNTGYQRLEHIKVTLGWDPDYADFDPEDQTEAIRLQACPDCYDGPGDPLPRGALDQGETATFVWTLECTEPGVMDLSVMAEAESPCEHERYADTAVMEVEQKELIVDVHEFEDKGCCPADKSPCVSEGDQFEVSATIWNFSGTGDPVENLDATIYSDPAGDGMVEMIARSPSGLLTLPHGTSITVDFTVECLQAGWTTLIVEAQGQTSPGLVQHHNDGSIMIYQAQQAHLVATILEPTDCVLQGTMFPVVVMVENTADSAAIDSSITLTIDETGDLQFVDADGNPLGKELVVDLGRIDGGAYKMVTVYARCEGVCDGTITVEPYARDCNTEFECPNWEGDSVVVDQLPLKATLDTTTDEIWVSDRFGVNVVVTNTNSPDPETGIVECQPCDVGPVTVELMWQVLGGEPQSGGIEVVGSPELVDLGTIYFDKEDHAEWTVHCLEDGQVEIWAEITAPCGEGTTTFTTNKVAVMQREKPREFACQLCKEWNMFSVPVLPDDTSIEAVFGNDFDKVMQVWTYDAYMDQWAAWVRWWVPQDYVDLGVEPLAEWDDPIQPGVGYFVSMYEPGMVVDKGFAQIDMPVNAEPWQFAVYQGWNLVGYTPPVEPLGYGDDMVSWHTVPTLYPLDYLASLDGFGTQGADYVIGDEVVTFRSFYRHDYPLSMNPDLICGVNEWRTLFDDSEPMQPCQAYWLYANDVCCTDQLYIVPPIGGMMPQNDL
jgi:hypothetical protein